MANKKKLWFYEGWINKNNEEEVQWLYAIPRPSNTQYDVYELKISNSNDGYKLIKTEAITFNCHTRKFSVETDRKPLKRKFNSYTIKNPDNTPKARMCFCENPRHGMEVYFALDGESEPQTYNLQLIASDEKGNPIPFNDSKFLTLQILKEVMDKNGIKNN